MRDVWTCPECARRFANRNQWHSCGNPELEQVLASASARAVELYWAVESALADCGEFRVHPQKTRVAFISRMTFASIRFARGWVDLSIIVARPIDEARIRRLTLYGPTSFGHEVRIAEAAEIDDDVRAWLCESLRRGDQETLDSHAHVEPIVGRALEILKVPLRAEVVDHDGRLACRIARHAAAAFDAHRRVAGRLGGDDHLGVIEPTADAGLFVPDDDVLAELGLGEGDPVDVFLRALL